MSRPNPVVKKSPPLTRTFWLFSVAVVAGLIMLLVQLKVTDNGQYMPAVHGDWTNHAATTRAIFQGDDLSSPQVQNILLEFILYPKLTYYGASTIAHLAGFSSLQGLTIIVILSLVFTCALYSLRLGTLLANRKISLLFLAAALIYLDVGSNWLNIGFRDLLVSNSFISQIASICLAQFFLYLSLYIRRPAAFLILMMLAGLTLINTHVVGFVWFSAALAIMALGFPDKSLGTRVMLAFLVILISIAFILSSPGVMTMVKISGTGGVLRAWGGKDISQYALVFVTCVCLYTVSALFLAKRCLQKKVSFSEVFWQGSGFLALGPLIVLSAVTVFDKGGNWYPVVKWIYLLFTEFLIFGTLFLQRKQPATVSSKEKITLSIFLVLAFFVQTPYFSPKINLEPAILAEDGLVQGEMDPEKRFPGLHVDHPALNYFISKSVLKVPVDEEYQSWVQRGTSAEHFWGAQDFKSVEPLLDAHQVVEFTQGNALAGRMLDNRWWPLGGGFVWASKSPATIVFSAKTLPKSIELGFRPHMPQGPQMREYRVFINGVAMPTISTDARTSVYPGTVKFEVPPYLVKADGKVKIQLSWDAINANDLGIALTHLEFE